MPDPSITISTAQVTIESSTTQLAIGWTQSGCTPPYQVTVKNETDSGQDDQTFSQPGWTGFPPVVCSPLTFNDGDTYSVVVSQMSGGSPVVSSPKLTLLTSVPAPYSLSYDGTNVTADWEEVDGTTQYTLFKGIAGQSVTGVPVGGSTTQYPVPWVLSGGPAPPQGEPSPYYMYIQAETAGGTVTSKTGNYYLLSDLPTPSKLWYDGSNLTAAWASVSGCDGYVITYAEVGKQAQQISTTDTSKVFSWSISGGGSDGNPSNYYVELKATYGSVVSSNSAQYYMIAESPTVTTFQNNGTDFEVIWSPVADTDGTQINLSITGTPHTTNVPSPATQKTVDRTPPTGSEMTTRGYMSDGLVLGPPTTALNPITDSGSITSLVYEDAGLEANWAPFTGTPTVDATELIVSGHDPIPGPATGPHLFTITLSGSDEEATLRGKSGDVLIGPAGPPVKPVQDIPTNVTLVWNRSDFIVSWTPVDDSSVTGYSVTLYVNGAAQTPVPATISPLNIPQTTLTDNTTYQVDVRAVIGSSKGPPSEKATGPYQTSVVYTADTQGRLVTEAWSSAATISYTIDAAGNVTTVTPSTGSVKA